jgi:hypothetical protein
MPRLRATARGAPRRAPLGMTELESATTPTSRKGRETWAPAVVYQRFGSGLSCRA